MGCDSADQRGSRLPKGTQEAIDLMGSAQRRASVFPIESVHLDEVGVECSSEEPVPVPGRTQARRPGKKWRRPNQSPQEIRVAQMVTHSLRRGPGDSNPRA